MGTVNGMMVKSGQIPASVNQGIRETSATAKATLGSRLALGDGRVFYYCRNSTSAALTVGKLVGPYLRKSERTDNITAVSVGTSKVLITAVADITANDYAEGYLVCANDAGEGSTYKILSNDAITAAATGYVYLEEGLHAALTTASDVYITKSPFSNIVLNPDPIRFTMGVPMCAVDTSEYFWCQTYGPAAVLFGDATGASTHEQCLYVDLAAAIDGACCGAAVVNVESRQVIGHTMLDSDDSIDTEYHIIMLKCLA